MIMHLKKEIQRDLESRGVTLSLSSFTAALESLSPQSTRAVLAFWMNYLRPFSAGMGFRVARWSDDHAEIIVPSRYRNRNERGEIHAAAIVTAAFECVNLNLIRHLEKTFVFQLTSQKATFHKGCTSDARVGAEWPSLDRELFLSLLRDQGSVSLTMVVQAFDAQQKTVAEIEIQGIVTAQKVLSGGQ